MSPRSWRRSGVIPVRTSGRTLPAMRGILSAAGYVPYWRLDRGRRSPRRSGRGGGKGTRVGRRPTTRTPRRWASRRPGSRCAAPDGTAPGALWFSTVAPGVPRQDQRHHDPRRAAPRRRRAPRSTSAARSAPASARCATALDGRRHDARRQRRPARRPADQRRRVRGRRRRRRAARRRRRRRPGDRRATSASASATEEFIDRWRTPGRRALEGVGGALRRDEVRRRSASRRWNARARRRPSCRPTRSTGSSSPARTPGPCER